MASTLLQKEIGNDPASMNSLINVFSEFKEDTSYEGKHSLYRKFIVNGQDIPKDNEIYIRIFFQKPMNGPVRISWELADTTTNL